MTSETCAFIISTSSNRGARAHWHRRPQFLCVCAVAWFLGPSAAVTRGQIQDPLQAVGIPPLSPQLPIEEGSINATDGNLHLEIPLGSFPQRGRPPFQIALVYDSAIWSVANGTAWVPALTYFLTSPVVKLSGWRIVSSGDSGQIWQSTHSNWICDEDGGREDVVWDTWTWTSSGGTVHGFPIYTTKPINTTKCGGSPATDVPAADGLALDNSGYHMFVTNYSNAIVYAPDGTIAAGANAITSGLTDTNGNHFSYVNQNQTDTLGRVPVAISWDGTTITLQVSNSQGGTSTYTATVAAVPVQTNFSSTGNNCREAGGNLYEIQSINLPDGTSYQFGYDSGTTAGHYGELTSMMLPTGSNIAYTYASFLNSEFNGLCEGNAAVTREISTRVTPDGTWNFTPAIITQCTATVFICRQQITVTKPAYTGRNDNEVYKSTINGGAWPDEVDYYTGAVSSSNLIATLSQSFDFSQGSCPYPGTIGDGNSWGCGPGAIYVSKTAEVTTLPISGGSVSTTTKYIWDGGAQTRYGNLTQKSEWNFGSSTSNPADRTTSIAYLSGTGYINSTTNILNRSTSVTVTDSSGANVAQSLNCFDYANGCGGSSFTDAGTVVNHSSSFGASYTTRGDLTQVKRLISGTSYLIKSMTYDTTGQMLSETDWNNNATTYSYADNFFTDGGDGTNPPSGYTPSSTTNAYIKTSTHPTVNSVTLVDSFGYYWGSGKKAHSTDPNSQTTYFHFYDSMDRPTSTKFPNQYNSSCCGWTYTVYPSSSETYFDKAIGITSTSRSISCTGTSGDCRHDQSQLDGLGRISSLILESDPDGATTVGTMYDSNGRVSSVSNPYRSSGFPTNGTESYGYDGLDRKIQVTHQDGSVSYIYYGGDATSGTHGGRNSQLCSGYGTGYPVLYKDEAATLRQSWFDGFGRLIEVDEPDPSTGSLTSGSFVKTCYAYDLNNNLIGVLQPGSETTCTINSVTYNRCFNYDMLSRVTSATNPESGTINYYYTTTTSGTTPCSGDPSAVCLRIAPSPNESSSYTVTTTYSYDALNRLIQKSYSDTDSSNPSTPTVQYGYDAYSLSGCTTTPPSLTIANGKGRRTSMCDGGGATSWSYDQVGNVWTEERTTNGVTNSFNFVYNLDGNVATVQYPSARTLTYQPGGAQRPQWVKDVSNSINYGTSAHYMPPGELAGLTNGSGIYFTAITNSRLQPCWEYATTGTALSWNSTNCNTTESNAGNILDLEYSLNLGSSDNGNLSGITNNRDTTRSQAFMYDYLNRIKQAETTSTHSTSAANCWGEAYTIDAVANLTAINAVSDSNYTGCSQESGFTISVNSHNQDAGSCYDAAGNKLGSAGSPPSCTTLPTTYVYDGEDRLLTTGGATYYYDGDGKRVRKSSGTLYWYGTSSDPLVETNGSSLNYEYVFLNGKRIARQDSSGNINYYFADDLGTARVVTNSSGTIQDDVDLYPYGGERPVIGPSSGNTYLFTGKERDSESGLDNFGARYNSSQYGRFMTPDSPSYSNRKNPQSWNLYAYALNNPVSFRDADGHEIDCANNVEQCKKDAATATANAEAAKRVTLNTTTTQHSFLGIFHWTTTTTQIGISGDINSFRALSPNASKLADLVTSKQTVTVSYDQFARPSFFANGEQLNGGSMSYTASQGYNWQAFIDPNRTPGVVYDQDAVDQHIPQANTGEEFGHEVLGHIWGEMFGGAPAGTRGNMRDSIIGEDAVRALDPTRGQKGLDSHHNMPPGDQ